MKMLH